VRRSALRESPRQKSDKWRSAWQERLRPGDDHYPVLVAQYGCKSSQTVSLLRGWLQIVSVGLIRDFRGCTLKFRKGCSSLGQGVFHLSLHLQVRRVWPRCPGHDVHWRHSTKQWHTTRPLCTINWTYNGKAETVCYHAEVLAPRDPGVIRIDNPELKTAMDRDLTPRQQPPFNTL